MASKIYPYQTTELAVETVDGDDEGNAQEFRIFAYTYQVTGRGEAGRKGIDATLFRSGLADVDLAAIGVDLVRAMVDANARVSVIGSPSTPFVSIEDLPPMTRSAAADLISQIAIALV